jgi:streptogramin lyase
LLPHGSTSRSRPGVRPRDVRLRGRGDEQAAPRTPTNAEPIVVAQIEVGSNPCIATEIEGDVWVSTYSDAELIRIDPEKNEVVGKKIKVGAEPCGIAFAEGYVWVDGYGTDMLERVDPERGKVTRRIPVGSDPWDVGYADGTVWVTNNVDGTVTRHDPETGKLVATIETGGSPANITAASGSVWVGSTSGTEIFRIRSGHERGDSDRGGEDAYIG